MLIAWKIFLSAELSAMGLFGLLKIIDVAYYRYGSTDLQLAFYLMFAGLGIPLCWGSAIGLWWWIK